MSKNLEEIFESNWDEIQGKLKSQWGKLTNQDIKQMEGSYDMLIGRLKKIYGYTKDELEEELNNFLSTVGIDKVKEKTKDMAENVSTGMATTWNKVIGEYVEGCMHGIVDKSIGLEKNVVAYAKSNPVKFLGAAAIITLALSQLFQSQKNS